MTKDLVCKCGYEKFYIATNKKVAMCPNCGTFYNDKGEEMKPKDKVNATFKISI